MTEREVKVIIQLTFERDEARDQRDALRKERDDARREIWEKDPRTMLGAREFFAARGWDCFKEENHNA